MRYLSLIFLFALSLPVFSQLGTYLAEPNDEQADSLQIIFDSSANDTLKMEISRMLAFYYHEKDTERALFFQTQQLELSRKLGFRLWEADALELCGFISKNMGQYPVSLQYFQESRRITENPKSEKNAWRPGMLSMAGTPSAARLTVQAFNHLDIGGLYRNAGDFEKELSNYRACVKLGNELNDHVLLSLAYGSIGDVYMTNNLLDSALYYSQLELKHTEKSRYYKYYGGALNKIGFIYYKLKEYKKSTEYFYKSIQSAEKIGNARNKGEVYIDISELFLSTNQPDSSLYYVRMGLHLAKKTKLPRLELAAFKILTKVFAKTGMIDSAYYYQNAAIASTESMLSEEKIVHMQNLEFSEQMRQNELKEEQERYQDKIRTRALVSVLFLILIIAAILFRNNRVRRKAYKLLHLQRNKLQATLSELKATQSQLVQSEKMASLGELTAGIAHEIQNPLNFVNNFSEVNAELIAELKEEVEKNNLEEVVALADDIADNEQKIAHHGKRADAIVKGMLQHSRTSASEKELTDINVIADEYLRLSYHGLRAKDKSFNANYKLDAAESLPQISVVSQDIGRVLLNLINNAFFAVSEKNKQMAEDYQPEVIVSTRKMENQIEIKVSDNGNGIPDAVHDKIFQPFFTTKPTGEGTGLGLSLSYDIIKVHGGEMKMETKAGEGTTFIILLPISN